VTTLDREQLSGYRMRDYDQLIAALAASREAQHMTMRKLAEQAHYAGHASVSYVLRGEFDASGRRLFDLAFALGYDLALVPREDA
jgi:transcriptional regulator with XRE-family HTH domain